MANPHILEAEIWTFPSDTGNISPLLHKQWTLWTKPQTFLLWFLYFSFLPFDSPSVCEEMLSFLPSCCSETPTSSAPSGPTFTIHTTDKCNSGYTICTCTIFLTILINVILLFNFDWLFFVEIFALNNCCPLPTEGRIKEHLISC